MSAYLAQFGFGQRTALDVQGARSGLLPSREWKRETQRQPWFPGETLSAGIGQGYWLATPLQLATATSVLANQGQWVPPRLLREVETDKVIPQLSVEVEDVPQQRQANWEYVFQSMQDVMHGREGTARFSGQRSSYRMAGKTGTAQVFTLSQDEEDEVEALERPEHLRNHAIYMGFAPVETPQIALAVIVENAAGGGSAVAAPIARKVFDAYLLRDRGTSNAP